jgi:hypothetical protein
VGAAAKAAPAEPAVEVGRVGPAAKAPVAQVAQEGSAAAVAPEDAAVVAVAVDQAAEAAAATPETPADHSRKESAFVAPGSCLAPAPLFAAEVRRAFFEEGVYAFRKIFRRRARAKALRFRQELRRQ